MSSLLISGSDSRSIFFVSSLCVECHPYHTTTTTKTVAIMNHFTEVTPSSHSPTKPGLAQSGNPHEDDSSCSGMSTDWGTSRRSVHSPSSRHSSSECYEAKQYAPKHSPTRQHPSCPRQDKHRRRDAFSYQLSPFEPRCHFYFNEIFYRVSRCFHDAPSKLDAFRYHIT